MALGGMLTDAREKRRGARCRYVAPDIDGASPARAASSIQRRHAATFGRSA